MSATPLGAVPVSTTPAVSWAKPRVRSCTAVSILFFVFLLVFLSFAFFSAVREPAVNFSTALQSSLCLPLGLHISSSPIPAEPIRHKRSFSKPKGCNAMFFTTATCAIAICHLLANSNSTSRKKQTKKKTQQNNKSKNPHFNYAYEAPTCVAVAADKQRQTRRLPLIRHSALLLTGRALVRHRRIIAAGCTFVLVSSSGDKVRCSKVILECPSPPPAALGYKSHLLAWQEIA